MFPIMMDFSSEFEIPAGPSQTIDSDSEEIVSSGDGDRNDNGGRSPIIRRLRPLKSRPPCSPIIPSKRRSRSPTSAVPAKTKPVRRALDIDFQDTEVSSSSEQDADENENVEIGSFEESEITYNQSDYCSQAVSSCGSSIGKDPQPIPSNKLESFLSASVLLSNLEDEENEDPDRTLNMLDSGKKRKHIRGGFAEQLSKLIERKKSQDALEKYQNKADGEKRANEEEFEIVEIQSVGNIHFLYGKKDLLSLNSAFCPRTPRIGDVVRFSSEKTCRLVGERTIWFGVTSLTIRPGKASQDQAEGEPESDPTNTLALNCPCRDDPTSTCLRVSTDFQLEMYKYNLLSGESLDSYSTEESSQSQDERNLTVANAVGRLGGFSSSPLSLSRSEKLQIEVFVHRVFFRPKVIENETRVGDFKFQISLLCEDFEGNFCLVKMSPEIEREEHWRVLFKDNWEYFQGSRITFMSPFHVQDRHTRSQNSQLFEVIRSIRETNQRFCYVLMCFPGAQFRMEETAIPSLVPQVSDPSQSTISVNGRQRRFNWEVSVIFFNPEDRVLHVVLDSCPGVVRLEVRKSLFIEKLLFPSGRFYFTCTVLGICLDTYGSVFLDCFSSIVNKCPVDIDISRLALPALKSCSTVSTAGDLVLVDGPVLHVDQESSLQWLQCCRCHSEDLQETESGWRCCNCGDERTPTRKIELVCDIGRPGATVRLSHSAKSVLPQAAMSDLSGFHPADVIGRMVPSMLCVMGTDSVAREF